MFFFLLIIQSRFAFQVDWKADKTTKYWRSFLVHPFSTLFYRVQLFDFIIRGLIYTTLNLNPRENLHVRA